MCEYDYAPEYEQQCTVTESENGTPGTCREYVGRCEPIYLGEEAGYQNVFAWHDGDRDCSLDMSELTDVCAEFYQECLAFLYGTLAPPALDEKCDPVYMGEDIGFMDIYTYFDADENCVMNSEELTAMCAEMEELCLSFIGVDRSPDACEPVYLGEVRIICSLNLL